MLAIDCGNSRIKWARFEAGRARDAGHTSLRGGADPWALLGAALAGPIDRVLVANVAGPEVAGRIDAAVRSRLGFAPEFVQVEARAHGIECAYREPATLGVDRWLAMIAARRLVEGPLAVVSAGTALTFDAVDAGGRHLGGLILPGDRLMIEALVRHTSQIPIVTEASGPAAGLDLLGRSTAVAVAHGTRVALAAAVDRAVATVARALAADVALIVTGGNADGIAAWLASEGEVRADLVLDGLAAIAEDEK
ncbi:MAG TPA: type III pantothenate kinase [Gammaproteobacteria bacterium]|nr:type III pantothenate kinase [Gammaproteobacteria bacterium]